MTIRELQERRRVAGIPGRLLCERAGVDRGRLSEIERGYVTPSQDEIARLEAALDELLRARERVAEVASRVGWPMG